MLAAILPALTSEALDLIVAQRRRAIEHARATIHKKWPAITGESTDELWSTALFSAPSGAGKTSQKAQLKRS
ncbi:MAG: hypothetical protein EXQ99_07875 [Alphaproteobacteria bacterium]|nr:hypothetical protein [Alphaproteobacteria bacterium]